MIRARPSRLLSLWFASALVVLMVLEILPVTGPALAKVGASFVAGWIVQAFLLALLVDVAGARLPLIVAIIPVLAYAGYYLALLDQERHVRLTSEALRASNPGLITRFDASSHSLVMTEAASYVASHAVPIVYSRDPTAQPDGYVSFRRAPTQGENRTRAPIGAARAPNILMGVERPELPTVTVTTSDHPGEGWKDWNIGEETTSIESEGRTLGVFRSAYVRRLPALPFLSIGCTFSGPPSIVRRCDADFVTQRLPIESRPRTIDQALYDDPVSIMLGIRVYSALERPELDKTVVVRAPSAPVRRASLTEDAAFAALEGVVRGQNPALSWLAAPIVAQNPSRLAPFASAMVKRFVDLSLTELPYAPGRGQQLALLAEGIAALSPSDFATLQDQLADFVVKDQTRKFYPLLYVRLGDLGARVFPIYRDHFLAKDATPVEKMLAALAVCRTGIADGELVSAMKAEFLQGAVDSDYVNYKTALFVTLVRLGQEKLFKGFIDAAPPWLKTWYNVVLSRRDQTQAGPNNCMPLEWPLNEEVPLIMAPDVAWTRQEAASSSSASRWPVRLGSQ